MQVNALKITGNTRYDDATLYALVADAEGKQLTLTQLTALVARITNYYHAHGYTLARAIIPQQTIRDGIVEIEVIEARYGKVILDNKSRVKNVLLEKTLGTIHSDEVIGQQQMDRALLLLSDIPQVAVDATLKPGEKVGTSDMLVNAAPSSSAVTGNMSLNNYGNQYTGRTRVGGTVNFINPILYYGDVLSVSAMSSGSGMNYGRVSYDTLTNGYGTHLGGAYSALHYILGDSLSDLHGHGTAQVASLWAKHPFIRSRSSNLYGQFQYDDKKLKDHLDFSGMRTDRNLTSWIASLSGDLRDQWLSGGINSWNVGLTSGCVSFNDTAAQIADSATANTQGSFTKWTTSLARLQRLTASNGLYLSFFSQWANTNLDSAEKMAAGGPYSVRAYDMGAISGDSGYQLTAELRHDMGSILRGQWQAIAFVDSEHVTVNKNTWTAGTNDATLSSVGLGVNWAGQNQLTAKAYVATPVGPPPTLVASTSAVRVWVEIGKSF